ncbi:uncharacterized protein ACA1_095900 [Acanthamoeba castellanii str. Neff]|uniref:Pyruvate dehydrogenase E1 component subunit beta n=1 Tax=Acanthamoeba castellanii (strain ATCC 30010 / Neff) TaxID=1257118 RepID=L8GIL6_ACACF|nr:uncharacterized protein ACA1_095900 [Acanthamoeba castellanii str. Neff]ELR12930.1 hypothetical protein ACA1_095900 [Acanthamoeba castellanii str. Neff]
MRRALSSVSRVASTSSAPLLGSAALRSRAVAALATAVEPKKISVREALREAIDEEMERDSRVVMLGEEVAQERVVDTPITEAGFAGIGVGAAMSGLVPIVEFMTMNFSLQAIDHIVNSAAKLRYMSGGMYNVPIVFRGPNGPPRAVGAQHSQCFGAWYSSVPGLKVVAPWNCNDAKGLLKVLHLCSAYVVLAAIRDPNPVVFLESEIGYNETYELSPEAQSKDYVLDIGKAHIEKEGSDITVLTFSRMVGVALEAAQKAAEKGISVEVVNLRSLRPLDLDTIVNSIKKTNRFVTVEEGWPQCGIGSEIIALANEHCFDFLDAPPERITGADVPMPYTWPLEDEAMVQTQNIVNAIERVCYRNTTNQ